MGFNAKLFEVILFPESFEMGALDMILTNSGIKDYAYILHDSDDKKDHVHVMIRTVDTRNSKYVAKWFGVGEHNIERVKGRFTDALLYLTHSNAPDKFQYLEEQVHSNFDWKKEADKKSLAGKEQEIYDKIVTGEIKEYNFHEHITGSFYIRNQRKIKSAFDYRKQSIRSGERKMDCVYITGDSGVGKTSQAKLMAVQRNLSYYISSGSNDILDGYQGQEVLILDDLRPSSLGLSDLLKLLDPHTASSVKSRYSNKILECQLIIITTTKPIDTFFATVFENEDESVIQLKRRCQIHMLMQKEEIHVSVWDDATRAYGPSMAMPNLSLVGQTAEQMTKKQQLELVKRVTGFTEEMTKLIESEITPEQQKKKDQVEKWLR